MWKYLAPLLWEGNVAAEQLLNPVVASQLEEYLVNFLSMELKYLPKLEAKDMIHTIFSFLRYPTFIPHMTLEEANEICHTNAKIDHMDTVGHFIPATIIAREGTNCHISYDGWKDKWNTWSDFTKELQRFAQFGSISARLGSRPEPQLQNLKIGSTVEFFSPRHSGGWVKGTIRRLDIHKPTKMLKSGQIQLQYKVPNTASDREFLHWAHVDDVARVRPISPKSTDA